MSKRLYAVDELNLKNTSGTYSFTRTSNILDFVKTPADDTTVVSFSIPIPFRASGAPAIQVNSVGVNFTVGVASLDAAPTIVVNQLTIDGTTRVIARAAVTQSTLTYSGTGTGGLAAGTYTANITFAAGYLALDAAKAYVVEVTTNAAATSTFKISGVEVDYS